MISDRSVAGAVIKAALIIIISYLFYIIAIHIEKPVKGSPVYRGTIQRVIGALRRGFHIKSPYISEEDLAKKARRHLR